MELARLLAAAIYTPGVKSLMYRRADRPAAAALTADFRSPQRLDAKACMCMCVRGSRAYQFVIRAVGGLMCLFFLDEGRGFGGLDGSLKYLGGQGMDIFGLGDSKMFAFCGEGWKFDVACGVFGIILV